jgi:hypothetical protein
VTVLKIDRDANRDERRAELAKILREAVWGRTSMKCKLRGVVGGVASWHYHNRSTDAFQDAIDTIVEAASVGLIFKAGDYWKPARDVYEGD